MVIITDILYMPLPTPAFYQQLARI